MADGGPFNFDAIRRHPLARKLAARLPESVRNSPAKSAVLGGLVVVMLAAWGRTLLRSPAAARAAAAVSDQVAKAVAAASPAPARESGGRTREAMLAWLREPIAPIDRNAFAVRPGDFPIAVPVPEPAAAPSKAAAPQAGVWDELAKSLARRADEQRRRDAALAEFRKSAAALELSTTVMTRPPTAILAGRAVREGDAVEVAGGAVRVLRIEPRRVVVGRGGMTAEVRMAGETAPTD